MWRPCVAALAVIALGLPDPAVADCALPDDGWRRPAVVDDTLRVWLPPALNRVHGGDDCDNGALAQVGPEGAARVLRCAVRQDDAFPNNQPQWHFAPFAHGQRAGRVVEQRACTDEQGAIAKVEIRWKPEVDPGDDFSLTLATTDAGVEVTYTYRAITARPTDAAPARLQPPELAVQPRSALQHPPPGVGQRLVAPFWRRDYTFTLPFAADADADRDGALDAADNCRGVFNPLQRDLDGDNDGDACDRDDDGDGVNDDADLCPAVPDPRQLDRDGDGIGDACDDGDGDGHPDATDLCPLVADPDRRDLDGDGLGDACDPDDDGDDRPDAVDPCPRGCAGRPTDPPRWGTPLSHDTDRDGCPDRCDRDDDGDGVPDAALALGDNCPTVYNPDQRDLDGDGRGDRCDKDDDGDGVPDRDDLCPAVADPAQRDLDGDGLGDACDPDDDGDRIADEVDNCPGVANPAQPDADADGEGDACDADIDGDGVEPPKDRCPVKVARCLVGDGPGRRLVPCPGAGPCAKDRDGDGIADAVDNCPAVYNPDQRDSDRAPPRLRVVADGRISPTLRPAVAGDACDPDDDGDGVPDALDPDCRSFGVCAAIDPDWPRKRAAQKRMLILEAELARPRRRR